MSASNMVITMLFVFMNFNIATVHSNQDYRRGQQNELVRIRVLRNLD